MVINKTKGIIIAVVILFVGYLGGAYIGVPFVDDSKLGSDIGKAKLYNNAIGGFAKNRPYPPNHPKYDHQNP